MALTNKEINYRHRQLALMRQGKPYVPQPVLKLGRPANPKGDEADIYGVPVAVYDAKWIAAIEKYLDKKLPSFQPADDIKTPYAAPIVEMDATLFDELSSRPWWGLSFGRLY